VLSRLIGIFGKPGTKAEKYATLTRFDLFKDLNSYELFQISNICHERQYQKDELIFDLGYPLEALFLVTEGEILLSGNIQPGGAQSYGKGKIIGLIDLFYEPVRHSKAVALSKTKVLAISREDFNNIIDDNPRLGSKLLKTSAKLISSHIFTLCEPGENEQ